MLKLYVTGNYFFAVNSAGNIFSCHKSKAVIRYDEMDDEKFDIYLEGVRLFDAVIYSSITNESNVPYASANDFVNWYSSSTGQSTSGGGSLPSNIEDALNGAVSPSSSNPFVTQSENGYLKNSQIINIITADIGANPTATFNNIQNKINAVKRFLGDGVTVIFKFQDATYDIGANTLSFDSFVGGTVFIEPLTTSFNIQSTLGGIAMTENLSVIYMRDAQVDCGTKVNIVANSKAFLNNVAVTTTSASDNALLINNSNVQLIDSVFEINNASNSSEPVLVTNNSQVMSNACLFTSNGTSVYGLLSQYNSVVNTFSSTVGGSVVISGRQTDGSIFSIHNMIEAFDPTGSTLSSTTKSTAIRELDNEKENSANKSTSAGEFASTTKFPVWAAIVAYFTGAKIRQLFGFIDGTVQTTNATATPILTIPITVTGDCFRYMVFVKGKSATNNVTFSVEVTYRNVGGVVSFIQNSALSRHTTFTPQGSTSLTFTSSGTNAIINVQGIAATTIDWEASYYKMI